jgi:hypothetical protein
LVNKALFHDKYKIYGTTMPKSTENINRDLEDLLNSQGCKVKYLDSSGESLPIPDEAEVFAFNLRDGGVDLGTVNVTADGLRNLVVYYDDTTNPAAHKNSKRWTGILRLLKAFAMKRQMNFELKNTDRVKTDMKRRAHLDAKSTDRLLEGYYGTRDTSYSDDSPTIKLIIKHNKRLEENDQRFRHIDRIFLETSVGERILVPTNKPSQARMFARHIAEGGEFKDSRWSHLQEICEDVESLGGFVRATKRGREQFNESAQRMIVEAVEKYAQLRESVKKLSTSRGYNTYFESYAPSVITETDGDMGDVFAQSSLDSRIERALPVLSKFGIKVGKIAESAQFEEWADALLAESLDPMSEDQIAELLEILADGQMKVGPNATNIIGILRDVLENDGLNAELKAAARKNANNEASPVIISWMERQKNPRYESILAKHEASSKDAEEPAAPAPKAPPAPTPEAPPAEEPASDAPPADDQAPEEKELPPMPDLKESEFSRLLKLSGL